MLLKRMGKIGIMTEKAVVITRIKIMKEILKKIKEDKKKVATLEKQAGLMYKECHRIQRSLYKPIQEALCNYISTLDMEWVLHYGNEKISLSGRDFSEKERKHINSLVTNKITYHWWHTLVSKIQIGWDDNETQLCGPIDELADFIIKHKIKCNFDNLSVAASDLDQKLKAVESIWNMFKK